MVWDLVTEIALWMVLSIAVLVLALRAFVAWISRGSRVP